MTALLLVLTLAQEARPRARDLGIEIGHGRPGRLNAITDVPGVVVGHTTLLRGEGENAVRTGVTAMEIHHPRKLDPLFDAAAEATEEAIVNALVAGRTMVGFRGNRVHGLPLSRAADRMRRK